AQPTQGSRGPTVGTITCALIQGRLQCTICYFLFFGILFYPAELRPRPQNNNPQRQDQTTHRTVQSAQLVPVTPISSLCERAHFQMMVAEARHLESRHAKRQGLRFLCRPSMY